MEYTQEIHDTLIKQFQANEKAMELQIKLITKVADMEYI
jgi:hypothetical protein